MIRVITEPKVYVVGRQEVGGTALAAFLEDEGVPDWTTDARCAGEELVEAAGRLCYMSFARPRPGGNSAYVKHILDVGHGSVLEHAVWSLIVTGVSRSLTHELVRHRAGFGFSQLSQRYVDESDVAFVVPPALAAEVASHTWHLEGRLPPRNSVEGAVWVTMCEASLASYAHLAEYLFSKIAGDPTDRRKQAREAARSVLPNCTETKVFVTANARAWRHFVELRANPAADAEMRRLAVHVLHALKAESPTLFGDIAEDGSTPHHKV